jgi:hypothetical protein
MRTVAGIVLLCLSLAAGCGGERETEATSPSDAAASPPAQSSRTPAPGIEGTTIDGERISLEAFRGRPVLVNVWSSW